MLFRSLATLAASTLAACADLPSIEIVGNKFFYSNNGSQFLMKGIAYQQNPEKTSSSFVDPLADADACKRDVPYMEAVDTNVIRVYALNSSVDHSECMLLLSDAGIYVIADLSQPDLSINRDKPQWDLELFNRYTDVVDEMQQYPNVLGFFAGNEVTNEVSNTDASAYVKAAVRDTKAYIKAKGYRSIPVGYSANDDTAIRVSLADYFACGDDSERADFFGINMYEWCGSSSFTSSGYSNITDEYKNLGIPIFFSEYGCNKVSPRTFQEVGTIYGDQMTDVWSGGIVYMYFQEDNDYGLVSVSGNSVSTLQDYKNYQSQIQKISPSLAAASAESASLVLNTACPTATNNWEAATALPPTPDKEVCDCMSNSVSCVVSSKVSSDDYADLFATVCGMVDCSGINGNGTTGKYGVYSPCSSEDRLNFVLDLYYQSQSKSKDACDFDGSASVRSGSVASSCSAIIKSAGVSGLGTVSGSIATTGSGSSATKGGSNGSSSSSSGSSKSSSSSSKSSGANGNFIVDALSKMAMIGGSLMVGAGLIFM